MRSRPLPQRELDICARLIEFRRANASSRARVARLLGISQFTLASIETGRAPLRFEVAWKLREKFWLHLGWLATGQGSLRGNLPIAKPPQASSRMLFSTVWDNYILPAERDLRTLQAHVAPASELLLAGATSKAGLSSARRNRIIRRAVTDCPEHLRSGLTRSLEERAEDLIQQRKEERLQLTRVEIQAAARTASRDRAGRCDKDILDIAPGPGTIPDMSSKVPTWWQLKAEVARLTAARGQKAALAAVIGVSRQALGNWLLADDQGAPNAECTLRLFKWVLDQRKRKL